MRKTRAVLLGTNAYPFLIRYWFELFQKYWQDEVDHVYIAISNPEHQSSWGATKAILESHPKIKVIQTGKNWPESISVVGRELTEESVWIPHDDTFIYKSGLVDRYFKMVEDYNEVVTPLTAIFNPTDLVRQLLRDKYPEQMPLIVPETGHVDYSFYCNMFFIPTVLMQKTTMDFGEFHLKIGQHSPLLDFTPQDEAINSDTNFKFELELLQLGAKFRPIHKIELANLYNMPDPIAELKRIRKAKEGPWAQEAGWIHLQTMAYHVYGLYWDYGEREKLTKIHGRDPGHRIINEAENIGKPAFTWSMTMKLAWIQEFMSSADYTNMSKYYDHAQSEIGYIIDYLKINRKALNFFRKSFHDLIWHHK